MRSFVVGWYGHGNIGDELLSVSAYKILQDAFGQPPIIASVNPKITSNSLSEIIPNHSAKIVRWPASMQPKDLMSKSLIRTFSAVVGSGFVAIGGGGMFSDWKGSKVHRWLEFISLCKKLRKKTILMGIGAGPFFDKAIAHRVGNIINRDVNLIIARDSMSRKYLEEQAGVTKEIKILPDLAFYLYDVIRGSPERREVLVANFVPFSDLPSSYEQGIIDFLTDITRDNIVELLPFHHSDWQFHKRLSEKIKSSNLQPLPLQNINAIIEKLSSAKVAILTRFHAIILGALLETPFVPLIYHHKSSELSHKLGLDDFLIDIGDGTQWKNHIPSASDYHTSLEQVRGKLDEISKNLKAMSEKQLINSRKYPKQLREI
ncbi:MAG: polysaccharide pyruvyl transferase family protein [Promethearchaeota archaeon]